MLADALLSWLHITAILILASALGAEALLMRAQRGPATLAALARADLVYGIAAALVLLTGLARLHAGAHGAAFLTGNPMFWTKMALFVLVGLLSILPTVRFIQWRRAQRTDAAFWPADADLKRVRRLVFIQLHLLAFVPLAAALMARGIGA